MLVSPFGGSTLVFVAPEIVEQLAEQPSTSLLLLGK
jgi:hypothetical protein